MKVLLIQPPRHPRSVVIGELEPYALEVLGAGLRLDPDLKGRIEVEILDLRIEKRAALEQAMDRLRPEVVGITGITIDQPMMVAVAERVKAIAPRTKVAVGGHHATLMPADFYRPCIDLIVRGPGTRVFPEVVKRLAAEDSLNGLAGVIYKTDGRFLENPGWLTNIEPSNLLSPDRSLVARFRKRYRYRGLLKRGLIVTSQGCPFSCTFCACRKVSNGHYLAKPPEQVIEELEQIPEPHIFFGDDHTFLDEERAAHIAERIAKKRIKKNFKAYSRADTIVKHPDLFRAWADVGLRSLVVGFESISDEGLRQVKKGSCVSINEEANAILLECGIHNMAHILIDPAFTREDFKQVSAYAYKLGFVHPVFPILTPLPGTDLWDRQAAQVHGVERQYFDLAHPVLETRLPLEEFYAELFSLAARNYSLSRWALAKVKKVVNALVRSKHYPWYECRAPDWYHVLFAYWKMRLIKRETRMLNASKLGWIQQLH